MPIFTLDKMDFYTTQVTNVVPAAPNWKFIYFGFMAQTIMLINDSGASMFITFNENNGVVLPDPLAPNIHGEVKSGETFWFDRMRGQIGLQSVGGGNTYRLYAWRNF